MAICDQGDGYLGKWLTENEQAAFEAHLANCPSCRQVIQEQKRLEELLTRANATLVPVPAGLMGRIDERLRRARRRRAVVRALGLIAAGILVCVVTARLLSERMSEEHVSSRVITLTSQEPKPTLDPRSLVKVTFQPPSDVIAVPQKTDDLSVTIIWVYPTIKSQETNPAPAELFLSPERNGI